MIGLWPRLVLAVLATWRIAHLLTAEDGPAGVIAALRRGLGNSVAGGLMDCFACCSLWVALPFALYLAERPLDLAVTWLALSGAAMLLERALPPPLSIREMPEFKTETGEPNDELLRSPTLRRNSAAIGAKFGPGGEC